MCCTWRAPSCLAASVSSPMTTDRPSWRASLVCACSGPEGVVAGSGQTERGLQAGLDRLERVTGQGSDRLRQLGAIEGGDLVAERDAALELARRSRSGRHPCEHPNRHICEDGRAVPEPRSSTPEAESLLTVVVALAANLGIALAKLVAALATGSSAML